MDYNEIDVQRMGIKYLNSYLKKTCNDVLPKVTFWELRGKRVAIDASIYMYRFAAQDELIEGMYQLTMLLLDHMITPIYVFDGPPPPEKAELIKRRRQERLRAKIKLDKIKNTNNAKNLRLYKRQSTCLRRRDVDSVKEMLTLCGLSWYQASGEADQVCAWLVKTNKVWACMSEDMDMLVYGCERVLRYLSVLHKTVVLYSLPDILSTLGMPFKDFQRICVLSGTDYLKGVNLYSIFAKYKSGQVDVLENANTAMFEIPETIPFDIHNGSKMNRKKLRTKLERHGFVFVNESHH